VIDEINAVGFLTPLWRRRLPPVVALVHQLATEVWDAELPRVLAGVGRWVEPRLLRLYADVPTITVSESTKRDLLQAGIRNVAVIPEGLDPPAIVDVPRSGVPSVLFVGRLTRNKRPDHAIEAFRRVRAELPDARLDIVGRGALAADLQADLPEGAVLHGFVPRDELYRLMARAHCMLVPSVREGFGLVVAEANSVGTPAVGYDVPGLRDSITHGCTGVLVPEGDVDAMARAALSILTDARQRERFSTAARSAVRSLSWDTTADRFMEALEGCGALAGDGIRPVERGPVGHDVDRSVGAPAIVGEVVVGAVALAET
jgi:glycosyltransferase involved in cell wall biosynthesis